MLLVMGFFFSSFPMVVIVLPLFLPSVMSLGIDPALYGALAVFCSIIGEVTPPMGPQLWIAAPICKEKIGNIMREAWAFLGVQVLALILVTFFPQISAFFWCILSARGLFVPIRMRVPTRAGRGGFSWTRR